MEDKEHNHEEHKEEHKVHHSEEHNKGHHTHQHKEHDKKEQHHKAEKKGENSTNANYWVYATVALVLLLITSVATHGFRSCPVVGDATDIVDTVAADPDNVVTIIEYSDFQCPFCGRGAATIDQVKEEYGNKVKVEFKNFPLSFHANAYKAAEAAECARDQDKFWELHDKMFANQDALSVENIKGYAKELGLDTDKFDACLDSGEKSSVVDAHIAQGKEKGVTGTPAFLINGEMLVGAQPLAEFKKVIDKALGVETTVAPDPEVKLTIVNDESCTMCDTSQLLTALAELFPKLDTTTIDYNSDEGKALVEKFDIIALPAYIFDSSLEKTASFAQVQNAIIKKDGSYVIHPAAAGSAKYLVEPNVDGDPVYGPKDAKVTIIEFSDYECPYCKRGYETMNQVKEKYKGKIKVIFKDFPLSFHPNAQKAAEASECAHEQDKFWEMHDWMFEHQDKLDVDSLKAQAKTLGLDTDKFNDCLDSGKYATEVAKDMADGQEAGVTGTQAFYINGIKISGAQPFEVFQQLIDEQLS